jgi:hypothetical protein
MLAELGFFNQILVREQMKNTRVQWWVPALTLAPTEPRPEGSGAPT